MHLQHQDNPRHLIFQVRMTGYDIRKKVITVLRALALVVTIALGVFHAWRYDKRAEQALTACLAAQRNYEFREQREPKPDAGYWIRFLTE